jgi:hypothetical protein
MIQKDFTVKVPFYVKIEMKPNQVYNFLKDIKFPQYFLLMNYKINKTLIQTLDEQYRPFSYLQLGTQALQGGSDKSGILKSFLGNLTAQLKIIRFYKTKK